MKPRGYQVDVINAVRQKIKQFNCLGRKPRIVIRLCCGAGKTATAAFISKSAIEKGKTVAFLVHRDFLLDQTSKTFAAVGIKHSYLAAGKWYNPWDKCHIGMIGSMKSRMTKIKAPDICFIDECQSSPANTWKGIIDAWHNTIFIGLSATPSGRTDGKALSEIYDDIVHGPSEAELISSGDLSNYKWYAPTDSSSSFKAGKLEYVQSSADEEMSKGAVVGDIIDSYKKYANGKIAIYFATSIENSKRYAEMFREAGIPAEHIDADTPPHERVKIAKLMAARKVLVMTNVMIASAGFDLSAQAGVPVTVEAVGLCRPTKSLPLLVQMSMRSMRAKDYPGIILDHVGAYKEHNWLPDDDVEWSLDGAEKKTAKSEIIQCSGCGAALKRNTNVCCHCGSTTVQLKDGHIRERSGPDHVDGELEEINKSLLKMEKEREAQDRKREQGRARSMEELIELAKKRGYKSPHAWARNIYKARGR